MGNEIGDRGDERGEWRCLGLVIGKRSFFGGSSLDI
jgi:hypothetical protein